MKQPFYVQFKGQFRDLKPLGWAFYPKYSDNHRAYVKYIGDNWYDPRINIWKAGRHFEIQELKHLTYLIISQIQNGEYLNWKHRFNNPEFINTTYVFEINRKEHTVLNITPENDRKSPEWIFKREDREEEKTDEEWDEFRAEWLTFRLEDTMLQELIKLVEDGLISVTENVQGKLYCNCDYCRYPQRSK